MASSAISLHDNVAITFNQRASIEEDPLLDLLRGGAEAIGQATRAAARRHRANGRRAPAKWTPKVLRGR